MTCFISDVLVQKRFERLLGRSLSFEELSAEEPFLAISVRGEPVWVSVPVLIFPKDLLLAHEGDYRENQNLFELMYE